MRDSTTYIELDSEEPIAVVQKVAFVFAVFEVVVLRPDLASSHVY